MKNLRARQIKYDFTNFINSKSFNYQNGNLEEENQFVIESQESPIKNSLKRYESAGVLPKHKKPPLTRAPSAKKAEDTRFSKLCPKGCGRR